MLNQKTKFIFLAIIFFGFFGLAESSEAADYYVSPTGAASWANCGAPAKNGTAACSWQTAMANAVAGDTVYFREGTYSVSPGEGNDYTPTMNPAHSGTLGNPITFIAYPGETPYIIGSDGDTLLFGVAGHDYIIWDGMKTQIFATTGVIHPLGIYLSNNITIRNCEFIGIGHTTYENTAGIQIDQSTYIYIYNNKFHEFSDANGQAVNTGAVWFMGYDHCYFYNNEVYNNFRGLQFKANPSHIYGYKNYFHDMTGPAFVGGSSGELINTDYYFYQNVLVNTGGIYVTPDASGVTLNMNVYNNTVYSVAMRAMQFGNFTYQNVQHPNIYNNIIQFTTGTPTFLMYDSGDGLPNYSDYNQMYGTGNWKWNYSTTYTTIADWRTNTGFDTNSITTNPNFINAGGSLAADYKRTSYPTNGRGGSYASVMGAYITGNEIIGYTAPESSDTTPPAAPSGLSVL